MNSSIAYLISHTFKNSLLELRRKPGKLVLSLLLIIAFVGLAILSIFTTQSIESIAPMFWFKGILFVFVTILFLVSLAKGLSAGDTFFGMNDVNLLFVSPVNPRSILLYGILRLAAMDFLAGFFILFQTNSLANFGISIGGVFLVFAVYMFAMVLSGILSLLVYSVTNGREKRKRAVKLIAFALYAPLIVYFIVQFLSTGNALSALESMLNSPFLTWIPISGWASEAATQLLTGNTAYGLLFLGVMLATGVALVLYIMRSKSDYYEDVLVATQTAFEKQRALEEGDINQAAASGTRKVKVAKTGIRGWGASAIFGKHVRETLRQNRMGFLSLSSVILIACAVVTCIFLPPEANCAMVAGVLMFAQIFRVGSGRGLRELYTHYIYMIPTSSFKKIIWSNLEAVVQTLVESVILFVACGLMLRDNPLLIVAAIAAYTLFTLLLIGINYASLRITGDKLSAGLLVILYLLAVMAVMLPGVIFAFLVGFSIGGDLGAAAGLAVLSIWELIMALVFFALSKGVLHNCDMPTLKPR